MRNKALELLKHTKEEPCRFIQYSSFFGFFSFFYEEVKDDCSSTDLTSLLKLFHRVSKATP